MKDSLVMCKIILIDRISSHQGKHQVSQTLVAGGQHDYKCTRIEVLVHDLSVNRGLDQVLFSKGYELPFMEWSGHKAQVPKLSYM